MPTSIKAARILKKDLERFRRALEEEKSKLSSELSKNRDAEQETAEEMTQDIADKASSSYTKEFLFSLTDAEREKVKEIDEALDRIEEGNYGLCQRCGNPIAEKRLNAVPWTPYCVDCRELAEKGLLD
jgi:RNA polymerase-binding transcription factor